MATTEETAETTTEIITSFDALFHDIGLDDRLRQAVKLQLLCGPTCLYPTLVQSKALPLAISAGRDLLVRSRTGSGKTLVYCLPLLQKLLQKPSSSSSSNSANSNSSSVRAVVLVPTRELCTQVAQVLQRLTTYVDEKLIKIAILSIGAGGGRNRRGGGGGIKAQQEMEKQQAMLRDEPNVVVATPGGLLVHLRSGAIASLKSVETFCIDEADLVLSTFGYSSLDIMEIVKSLPRICQGFLLSATLTPELESLKKIVLHSPVILKLEQDDEHHGNNMSSTARQQQQLKQFYLQVANKKDKLLVLYVFLKLGLLQGKGLFFVNTTDAGYRLKLFLEQFHVRSVAVLNAELPFSSRCNILQQFNYGNFDYLIATDNSTDAAVSVAVAIPAQKKKKKKNDDNKSDDSEQGGDDNDDDDDDEEIQDKPSPKQKQQEQKGGNKKQKTKKKNTADAEYGVARGLDFRNVSFVVNVDFPPNARSYAHRVGRTARGNARGVALSLVQADAPEQYATLLEVQQDQPPLLPTMGMGAAASSSTELLQAAAPGDMVGGAAATASSLLMPPMMPLGEQPQPTPLDFDLKEIEGFRYRVEDVSRAVTRIAVQEARAAELRAEILNSERLQSHYFEDNPADLQLLRHDRLLTSSSSSSRASGGRGVLEHLKHVPKYLLPKGAQVAKLNRKRKKKRKNNNNSTGGARRTDNDPLQSFNAHGNTAGAATAPGAEEEGEQGEDDPFAEFMEDDDEDDDNEDDNEGSAKKKQKSSSQDSRIFANARDGTGESTAGRNLWKEKHRKGKFSKKKRTGGKARRGEPLGI